jgi:hypothetical protein
MSVDSSETLEPRDQIVIKGKKPSYASACADNQAYALACLCFGVKGQVQQTVTKITTITSTIKRTTVVPTSVTTATTTTELVIAPTSCSTAQVNSCRVNNQCFCVVNVETYIPSCWYSYYCFFECTSDAQCANRFPGTVPSKCIFDGESGCGIEGRKLCTVPADPLNCAAQAPGTAKRELEDVFSRFFKRVAGVYR